MPTCSNSISRTFAMGAILIASLGGCKARQMGVQFSDTQSTKVDATWIQAAVACWPDLAHQGFSVPGMKRYLADPLHFRAAFGTYAELSDTQLIAMISGPVSHAPSPDTSVLTHASTPILTRDQAVAGTRAENSPTSSTDGSAPIDALCAVQSGTPIGFR